MALILASLYLGDIRFFKDYINMLIKNVSYNLEKKKKKKTPFFLINTKEFQHLTSAPFAFK